MGILLAGGCDESCHEHLDDTLFYPFSTGKWETLDAKVYHQNILQIIEYQFMMLQSLFNFSSIFIYISLTHPEWEPAWLWLMANQQWLEDTTQICWNQLRSLTELHGPKEVNCLSEVTITECHLLSQKTFFLAPKNELKWCKMKWYIVLRRKINKLKCLDYKQVIEKCLHVFGCLFCYSVLTSQY